MKKMMIALAMAALAFSVQAELVDPTFDGGVHLSAAQLYNTSVDTLNTAQSILNNGWTESGAAYSISGGIASFIGTTSGNAGLGQMFTTTLTGTQTLSFDVNYDMLSAMGQRRYVVQLVGFNDSDDQFSVNLTTSTSNLSTTNADGTIAELLGATYSPTGSSGGFVNTQLDVDFGTGDYEYYVLKIQTINMSGINAIYNPDNADVFQVDNVGWAAVPEPATALLLGFGGIGAWMLRRNLRQAKEQSDE